MRVSLSRRDGLGRIRRSWRSFLFRQVLLLCAVLVVFVLVMVEEIRLTVALVVDTVGNGLRFVSGPEHCKDRAVEDLCNGGEGL